MIYCLFLQADNDRNNVLTRSEIHRELAYSGLHIDPKIVSSLIAFLDWENCGYVTFGDIYDSLTMFRKFQSLPVLAVAGNRGTLINSSSRSCTPLSHKVTPSAGHLGLGMLDALPSITPSKKLFYPTNDSGASAGFLDITDPEILSLVDYLMNADDRYHGQRFQKENQRPRDKHTEWEVDVGLHQTRNPTVSFPYHGVMPGDGYGDSWCEGSTKRAATCNNDQGRNLYSSGSAGSMAELRRPLSSVMTALNTAESSVSDFHSTEPVSEHARGPGPEAIPFSAARVCMVLKRLQRLWRRSCQGDIGGEPRCAEVSDEELDAAVRFFDTDSTGLMQIEDVMTVFHEVRGDRVARCRLPTAALTALIEIGRHFDKYGINATEFVYKAASSEVAEASPSYTVTRETGVAATDVGGVSIDSRKEPIIKMKEILSKTARGPHATVAQLETLLHRELPGLTEKQRGLVTGCVKEEGLVWGVQLADAVRRARLEVSQRRQDHRHQQKRKRVTVDTGIGFEDENSTTDNVATCRTGTEYLAPSGSVTANNSISDSGHFNQLDATQLLDYFIREAGGLRMVTMETAVASWNSLKRSSRGTSAYRAGRSAARGLRRLLHERSVKPTQWFNNLPVDEVPVENNGGTLDLRVPVSDVMAGVNRLVATTTSIPEKVATGVHPQDSESTDQYQDTTCDIARANACAHSVANGGGTDEEGTDHEPWSTTRLIALGTHLDPCEEGSVTSSGFQASLSDCCALHPATEPAATHFASARRFEGALRGIGCDDVCGVIAEVVGKGPGAHGLIQFMRRMGDCCTPSEQGRGLNMSTKEDQVAHALADRDRVRTHTYREND